MAGAQPSYPALPGSGRPGASWPDLLVVLGVYALAHAWMPLNLGAFWDDWLIVGGTSAGIAQMFSEYGLPMFGAYYDALSALGIPAYRILVFSSYLAAAVCLWAILGRIAHIDRRTAFFLLLIFVLFPSNSARISIMASRTSVCSAFFFIGLWTLAIYLDGGRLRWRIASLAFFFVSFLTHSILVFYGVALALIVYHVRFATGGFRALVPWFARHPDFLLLPAVFWAIKSAFWTPYAGYHGYNRVTTESGLLAFNFIDSAVRDSFVAPIVDVFALPPLIVAVAAAGAAYAAYRLDTAGTDGATMRRDGCFLLFGFGAFVAGVLPYLAVGKVPGPDEWDSRHQLLTPLGASFMLVYLARLGLRSWRQNAVLVLFAVLFVADNARVWLAFQRDWYKQVAVMENLKTLPEVRGGRRFVFEDRATHLDANGRSYRDYEYTGLLQLAFGDTRREGRRGGRKPADTSEITLLIESGSLQLTAAETVKLRILESTDDARFRARVAPAMRVTVLPASAIAAVEARR
jgi:hypothetical protein